MPPLAVSRSRWSGFNVVEKTIHDVSVNVSKFRVLEGLGEGPDNRESQLLPEFDGTLVGADNKVELNGL